MSGYNVTAIFDMPNVEDQRLFVKMQGLEFYFDSANVSVSVTDNKDNSDTVAITFTPPA